MKKLFCALVVFCFLLNSFQMPSAHASELGMPFMPKPGTMVGLSQQIEPAMMVGLQLDAKDPFKLNFIMDKGVEALSEDAQKDEYAKVIKYFLASLTMPNKDMWVNLSPYEHGRIIPEAFSKTQMGRDLLAQDYLLKQITASTIYPDGEVGKKFWQKIYQQSSAQFHTTQVPINTFNKVWILPDKAVVYEHNGTAMVMESHLKVMFEEDYLATIKQGNVQSHVGGGKSSHQEEGMSTQIIREIILPALEREVNTGKNFAPLRQAYSGMIMATYFKKALRQSILGQIYADQEKVAGVDLKSSQEEKEKIYQQYLQAYKKGVFNYIKEDVDALSQQQIPRKYFSGGAKALKEEDLAMVSTPTVNGQKMWNALGKAARAVMVSVALVTAVSSVDAAERIKTPVPAFRSEPKPSSRKGWETFLMTTDGETWTEEMRQRESQWLERKDLYSPRQYTVRTLRSNEVPLVLREKYKAMRKYYEDREEQRHADENRPAETFDQLWTKISQRIKGDYETTLVITVVNRFEEGLSILREKDVVILNQDRLKVSTLLKKYAHTQAELDFIDRRVTGMFDQFKSGKHGYRLGDYYYGKIEDGTRMIGSKGGDWKLLYISSGTKEPMRNEQVPNIYIEESARLFKDGAMTAQWTGNKDLLGNVMLNVKPVVLSGDVVLRAFEFADGKLPAKGNSRVVLGQKLEVSDVLDLPDMPINILMPSKEMSDDEVRERFGDAGLALHRRTYHPVEPGQSAVLPKDVPLKLIAITQGSMGDQFWYVPEVLQEDQDAVLVQRVLASSQAELNKIPKNKGWESLEALRRISRALMHVKGQISDQDYQEALNKFIAMTMVYSDKEGAQIMKGYDYFTDSSVAGIRARLSGDSRRSVEGTIAEILAAKGYAGTGVSSYAQELTHAQLQRRTLQVGDIAVSFEPTNNVLKTTFSQGVVKMKLKEPVLLSFDKKQIAHWLIEQMAISYSLQVGLDMVEAQQVANQVVIQWDQAIVVIISKDNGQQDQTLKVNSGPGGIDFNDANLNMLIKRDGTGMPLPMGLQDKAMLNVPGFSPIIIKISAFESAEFFNPHS